MVDLMVLGWDGADCRHLNNIQPIYWNRLKHKGRLLSEPHFRGLYIDSGNAWTTITTGVPANKHGIHDLRATVKKSRKDFYERALAVLGNRYVKVFSYLLDKYDGRLGQRIIGYILRKVASGSIPRSTSVSYKRLWDYLSMVKSLIFSVPVTYPAWKINGVMVSGLPLPRNNSLTEKIYPKELGTKILNNFDGYFYMPNGLKSPLQQGGENNLNLYQNRVKEVHYDTIEIIKDLNNKIEFDLMFIILPIIDDYLHSTADWEKIVKVYELLDTSTEELVHSINPKHVLILSDHGMSPCRHPRIKMNHDSKNGIWGSDYDFELESHLDVTPAILKYFGKEFEPRKRDDADGSSLSEEEEVLAEHLRALGYLD